MADDTVSGTTRKNDINSTETRNRLWSKLGSYIACLLLGCSTRGDCQIYLVVLDTPSPQGRGGHYGCSSFLGMNKLISAALRNLLWCVAIFLKGVTFILQSLLCVFRNPMITKSSLSTQLLLHSSQFIVLLADGPDFNGQVHCDWQCWCREIQRDSDSDCCFEVAVNFGQYPTLLAIFHLLFLLAS